MFQLLWFGLVLLAALPLCDTCWKTVYVKTESCGHCGDEIQVSFTVRNKFQEPYFEHSHTVSDMPQRELIHFMEAAAENKSEFSFTVEYQKKLGFFINKMNGLTASNLKKTFWKVMSTSTGKMLPLGVSQYIPQNNESITFDFTTWATPAKSRAKSIGKYY